MARQDVYMQLLELRPTAAVLWALFLTSVQQSILSEPVCRALEALLYGRPNDTRGLVCRTKSLGMRL
jgi:hypothetical protein